MALVLCSVGESCGVQNAMKPLAYLISCMEPKRRLPSCVPSENIKLGVRSAGPGNLFIVLLSSLPFLFPFLSPSRLPLATVVLQPPP